MLHTKPIVVCTVLLMLVTASAEAQRRGGMRGQRGQGSQEQIMIQLLAMKEVQKELKMGEDFADEMKDVMEDVREGMQEAMTELREEIQDAGGFREMDEDDRRKLMEKMNKMRKEVNDEAWKSISKKVSKDQMKRLNQLVLQRQGTAALFAAKMRKELEITDEQFRKMSEKNKELVQDLNDAIQEARQDRDFEAMQEAQAEYREESKKAFMGILTDKQKKKYKEMMGEEFKFPARQMRRGRGRN